MQFRLNLHLGEVGQVEQIHALADRDPRLDARVVIVIVGIDEEAVVRRPDGAAIDLILELLQLLRVPLLPLNLPHIAFASVHQLGFQLLHLLRCAILDQVVVRLQGTFEVNLILLLGNLLGSQAILRQVAHPRHLPGPLQPVLLTFQVRLAQGDLRLVLLFLLNQEPFLVLAQGQFGRLDRETLLVHLDGLLLQLDLLLPHEFLVLGGVELTENVPFLDPGTLGKNGHDHRGTARGQAIAARTELEVFQLAFDQGLLRAIHLSARAERHIQVRLPYSGSGEFIQRQLRLSPAPET